MLAIGGDTSIRLTIQKASIDEASCWHDEVGVKDITLPTTIRKGKSWD